MTSQPNIDLVAAAAWGELLRAWAREHVTRRLAWLESIDGQTSADLHEAELHWRASTFGPDPYAADLGASHVWSQMTSTFGLSSTATHAVLMMAAAQVDGEVRQDLAEAGRGVISTTTVLRAAGCAEDWSSLDLALQWKVVAATEPPSLDAEVLHWIMGGTSRGQLLRVPEVEALEGWPVDDTVSRVGAVVAGGRPARLVVRGTDGSGRKSFAALVCRAFGMPLAGASDLADFRHARRCMWELGSPLQLASDRVAVPLPPPIHVVVAGPQTVVERALHPACVDVEVRLQHPGPADLQALWGRVVDGDVSRLAARQATRLGDVAEAASRGLQDVRAIEAFLNQRQRHAFVELAQHVPCEVTREQLVVDTSTSDALDLVIREAQAKAVLFADPTTSRFFGHRRGLVALFHGPSGCGKTMAAQVVASELGVDLFRVDVSAVVSKWVGETMKNLKQVLDRAGGADAVVLFDEADSLFSQRSDGTDANDRHANTDTTFLLQALEEFEGVALLASNRRNHLDAAFARRFRHVVEFSRPNEEVRREMWQRFFQTLGVSDAAVLASAKAFARIDLSGAEIKGALRTAMVRSGNDLELSTLLDSVDYELNKSNRGLSQRDRATILGAE